MSAEAKDVCILLDACIPTYVLRGLRRRGFKVKRVGNDVTQRLKDFMIVELARRWKCIIVTKDSDFGDEDNAVVIPHEWFKKYNSWEIVTKIVIAVFTNIKTKKPMIMEVANA